jgi:O-antigen/teichoic acid export membrane protein
MPKVLLKIGQNTGTVLLMNSAGAVLGFLMAAALGRGLGDIGFGQYSFVMTWVLSLVLLAEFGLSTILTRDLAAQPAETPRYFIHSLAGKGLLALPLSLLLLFFAPYLVNEANPALIAALRWGVLPLYSGLIFSSFSAVFKAHQVMTPLLWLTLIGQTTLLLGTLGLLLSRQPLFSLIAWGGLNQGGQCLLAYIFYRKGNFGPGLADWPLQWAVIATLLQQAWPFALAGFLAIFQLRVNILLLAYLQGDQALGWYAAANRFLEMGKQLPAAFYTAILPALAALAGTPGQAEALEKTMKQARFALFGFGVVAAGGALVLAPVVVTLTYGAGYEPAGPILLILTLSLIPNSQNSLMVLYLYALGDEGFVNRLMAWGVVINLGLCWWLIPWLGPAGTALALLGAETALYLPYRWRTTRQRQSRGHP